MTFKRARSAEQRETRRQTILDTATAMLDEMPVADVSLNELSRRVGLAKSNVLRYFESREEVLLELLERELLGWLIEVTAQLEDLDPEKSVRERGDRVARVIGRSLAGHTVMCDLINAQAGVLERNVSVDKVVRFKHAAATNLERMVDLIREHLPELGDETRTICVTTVIMAGALSTYCDPSENVIAAYRADPSLAALQLDMSGTLQTVLATMITGVVARADATTR